MSHQAPFTAFYRLAIPATEQTRLQKTQFAQTAARRLYTELAANASLTLAKPGGSQFDTAQLHKFTDINSGMMYVPQFGESPAQLRITGFYVVATKSAQNYANQQLIIANETVYGPVSQASARDIPNSDITTEIKALKVILDAAAATVNSSFGGSLETFRTVYKGITWGDRGFHYPL